MSIKSYLKNSIRHILNSVPTQQTIAQIIELAPTELLKGRKALITGGTSGIGRAIATAFLRAGADVVITSRNEDSAIRIAKDICKFAKQNGIIHGIALDMKDVERLDDKLTKIICLPGIGKIDILVNNAGINRGKGNTQSDNYDDIMDTNLKGYYFMSKCIADYMISKGIDGNILNIASASSLRPANSPYILSKWGVRGLTVGLAKQYLKYGIVVNGLAPGPTATPMLMKTDSNNINLPNNPSGRFALPEEIANMAVVLTSQMGRLIVGDIVYMTGGAGTITYDDIKY